MKKKLLIISAILIIIIIIFWCIEYVQKDNIYTLKKVMGLKVNENNMSCIISNSYHFNSWNYYYILENRTLYITAYKLSYFNPMAKHEWLDVKIKKGYDDFDKIYVNGKGEKKVLIWSKEFNQ